MSTAVSISSVRTREQSPSNSAQPSSPIGRTRDMRNKDKSVCYVDDTSEEDSHYPWEDASDQHCWEHVPLKAIKFVDDITGRSRNNVEQAISHYTTKKERRLVWAEDAEHFFDSVNRKATQRGMVVNPTKTKLVCIAAAQNSAVSSFINVGDTTIRSGPTMKVVGYTFGSRPGPAAHLADVRARVLARMWILRNLKKAQIPSGKLVQVFCAMIGPLMEYASPAFHTMMTSDQPDALERLQRNAMKIIFGFHIPYGQALRTAGIKELATRREEIFQSFTRKAYRSPL